MKKYEVKSIRYNWEKKEEYTCIATAVSFDNEKTLRVIVEGKKRARLYEAEHYSEVIVTDLETNEIVLVFEGTSKPVTQQVKSMKMTAEKGNLIRLNTNDGFYKEHGFPDEGGTYKVVAAEQHGVFIKEYGFIILHSDYEIIEREGART